MANAVCRPAQGVKVIYQINARGYLNVQSIRLAYVLDNGEDSDDDAATSAGK